VNIGSGKATSVLTMANTLATLYGRDDLKPEIVNRFRSGDVRHCYGDISRIKALGFEPKVALADGLRELVEWGQTVEAVDGVETVHKEMLSRGLIKE
jgi:dTDP-L-rhamnose 4-epimerase